MGGGRILQGRFCGPGLEVGMDPSARVASVPSQSCGSCYLHGRDAQKGKPAQVLLSFLSWAQTNLYMQTGTSATSTGAAESCAWEREDRKSVV